MCALAPSPTAICGPMAISLVAGTTYAQTEAYVSRLVGSHLLHVEVDPQAGENDLIFLIEDTLKIGL